MIVFKSCPCGCSAGTSIHAAALKGSLEVFEAEAWPVMQQNPTMWPYCSQPEALKAFEACAGMVQTRSFHMAKVNHMKGTSEQGVCRHCIPTCCVCQRR